MTGSLSSHLTFGEELICPPHYPTLPQFGANGVMCRNSPPFVILLYTEEVNAYPAVGESGITLFHEDGFYNSWIQRS